jgi:peptide deformylase
MPKLEIIKIPNEILRKKSNTVETNFVLSDEGQNLIKDMIETMYKDDGVGLAATQINHSLRICVIGKEATKNTDFKGSEIVLINPEWQKISRKTEVDMEGCLSVPKTFGKVKRQKDIIVKAINTQGEAVEFEAHKFFARVIQHEVDHLNGILFIDKAKDIQSDD